VDFSFLLSNQPDLCQAKYISPLIRNQICFENHINQDVELLQYVQRIIKEYGQQDTGYELAIKAAIYNILIVLLRQHKQNIINKQSQEQRRSIYRLRKVLEYIEQHYSENIGLTQLVNLANMSNQYFCRIFKSTTGKRPMEYINYLRINKAALLLLDNDLNISEIAMTVGFDDSNYFSRLFKKYKKISPSEMRKYDNYSGESRS
jgi:AraC-like DNA-binding protein